MLEIGQYISWFWAFSQTYYKTVGYANLIDMNREDNFMNKNNGEICLDLYRF